MLATLTVIAAATFTLFTGPNTPDPKIEALIDRGPIVEMIVRCPVGTAIITYSKMERVFCDPRLRCGQDKNTVIARTCR